MIKTFDSTAGIELGIEEYTEKNSELFSFKSSVEHNYSLAIRSLLIKALRHEGIELKQQVNK